MHYLHSIIGTPAFSILPAGGGCAAVLTDMGFAVCEAAALDTGWQPCDDGDCSERCEFKRGQLRIRVDPATTGNPAPCWSLNLVSGWIVILPFQSLPPESRAIVSAALPEGTAVPEASVTLLRRAADAHRTNERRRLRLRDALADAGYPSPVTLEPTGLHSAPLRILRGNQPRPLPLPRDQRLDTILAHWSGEREVLRFQSWRAGPVEGKLPKGGAAPLRSA
ncbi:MAG: hypothetical protein JWM59_3296 [Verrucomicrobiales bacterium]|nr:hypothetical protein [Verrucomicrobiales bacterium]